MSTMLGDQSYGVFASPTLRRMGFGCWHLICAAPGGAMRLPTTFQKGLLGAPGSFWTKSKAPGPSEVPAAKELPIAAGHVFAVVPFGSWKVKLEKSTKLWNERTLPVMEVKPFEL